LFLAVVAGFITLPPLVAPLFSSAEPIQSTAVEETLTALREGKTPTIEGSVDGYQQTGDSPAAGAPVTALPPIEFSRDASPQFGRLIIPAVGLDVGFVSGVHNDALVGGPGHWPGTPLPGGTGNSVLSGHRTTFTHPFGDLDLLQPGDTVTTGVGSLPGVEFRVTGTQIVEEEQYLDVVLAQPEDPNVRRITLFACHPKGFSSQRIVVTAEVAPVEPVPAPRPNVSYGPAEPADLVAPAPPPAEPAPPPPPPAEPAPPPPPPAEPAPDPPSPAPAQPQGGQ
jgi:LPXTG-site transpeptidase (sortase) family protein